MNALPRCTQCGAEFRCGAEAGDERCWCVDYPRVRPEADAASCLCPDCLALLVKDQAGHGSDEPARSDGSRRRRMAHKSPEKT